MSRAHWLGAYPACDSFQAWERVLIWVTRSERHPDPPPARGLTLDLRLLLVLV